MMSKSKRADTQLTAEDVQQMRAALAKLLEWFKQGLIKEVVPGVLRIVGEAD